MTSASFAAIRKVKVGTTDARYVIDPNTIQNGTELPAARPAGDHHRQHPERRTAPGKARVALVDFSKVVVARDVNAEVKILDQTWGDYDTHRYPRRVALGHRAVAGQGRHAADRGITRGRGRPRRRDGPARH